MNASEVTRSWGPLNVSEETRSWGPTHPCVGNKNSSKSTLAEQLFRDGFNCAQSVFCAYAEDFGLDRATAAKISCGLGGGVGRMREVCGAVTGASLVLGLRHGEDKTVVYPHVQEFCRRFKEEVGSIVCRELLALATLGGDASLRRQQVEVGGAPEARTEAYYKKRPCVELVKLAVRLLEESAG